MYRKKITILLFVFGILAGINAFAEKRTKTEHAATSENNVTQHKKRTPKPMDTKNKEELNVPLMILL